MSTAKAKPSFSDAAPKKTPGVFEDYLRRQFGAEEADKIVTTLEQLQIPIPQDESQFVAGQAGPLIFSNKLGVMIRIETKTSYIPDDEGFALGIASRANDSAWMLQPLGTIDLGKNVIEILPGIHYESRDVESRKLFWKMWADGYLYWDERLDNTGRLPKLPGLPGTDVTVILDRLGAAKLTEGAEFARRVIEVLKGERNLYKYRSPIRVEPSPNSDLRQEWDQMVEEVLKKKPDLKKADEYDLAGYKAFMGDYNSYWPKGDKEPGGEPVGDRYITLYRAMSLLSKTNDGPKSQEALGAKAPQELLYGGLRKKFLQAWPEGTAVPDPKKIAAFWYHVSEAKKEGRLVTGWNEVKMDPKDYLSKVTKASKAAEAYEKLPAKIGVKPGLSIVPKPR